MCQYRKRGSSPQRVKSNMRIIDTHCDTLLRCFLDKDWKLSDNEGHISISKMRSGGALAQFFAIYIDRDEFPEMSHYDKFTEMHRIYEREIVLNSEHIAPALCEEDILKNMAEGRMSSILAIEDGVVVDDSMERLEEVYQKGVRLITLTWNYENAIGYPCSNHQEEHMKGLKPFGIEAVERMNDLGIIVDVSHLSEGGFYDVARLSKKPFIASHSCARQLCDHRRNLTDHQLRTLGEKGGFVGVNFCSAFLREGSDHASIDDIVRHTVYMADKAGIESVGMGSDFDGIDNTLEMKDYAGYPLVMDALSKHFTQSEIDMICSRNIMRVIRETMK